MHKDDQMTPKERAFALFAKETVGDKMSIMGNVSPIEILEGTPDSIQAAVIDCFRKCWDNPRGSRSPQAVTSRYRLLLKT